MSTFGQRVKERREALRMTQEELATKLGYKSRSSINKIEMDENDITHSKLRELAYVLKTSISYLVDGDESSKVLDGRFVMIPLFDAVSCGLGNFVDEMAEDYIQISHRLINPNVDYFAQTAQGDSMINENIYEGDILIFERTSFIENGQIGAFSLDDNISICKKFYRDPRTKIITLQPANNEYFPIIVMPDDSSFRVIGKLKMVINNRRD